MIFDVLEEFFVFVEKAIEWLDFLITVWSCFSKNRLIISFGVFSVKFVENETNIHDIHLI